MISRGEAEFDEWVEHTSTIIARTTIAGFAAGAAFGASAVCARIGISSAWIGCTVSAIGAVIPYIAWRLMCAAAKKEMKAQITKGT